MLVFSVILFWIDYLVQYGLLAVVAYVWGGASMESWPDESLPTIRLLSGTKAPTILLIMRIIVFLCLDFLSGVSVGGLRTSLGSRLVHSFSCSLVLFPM